MATTQPAIPINGNYGTHHYGAPEQATSPQPPSNNSLAPAPDAFGAQETRLSSSTSVSTVSREEVGWYFVEQYYTNLSKSPEQVHLFYNRKSSSVWGEEGEKVLMAVGRASIEERVKSYDFRDTKVRVSNVDSQGSISNSILVQVIGEMSNKSAPHRKFTQTFVLAEQSNGYYVLNDIFRYIKEDEEEAEAEPLSATVAPVEEPELPINDKVNGTTQEPAATDSLVSEAAEKLQSTTTEDSEPEVAEPAEETGPEPTKPNGISTAEVVEIESKNAPVDSTETLGQGLKEPEPTHAAPTPSLAKSPPPAAVADNKPSIPKTWANLVAASGTILPKAPSSVAPPAANTASTNERAAPKATQESAHKASPSAVSVQSNAGAKPAASGSEWTTAGDNHKKSSKQPQFQPGKNGQGVSAYIKFVTENVSDNDLRKTLEKHGKLSYFDISRAKVCGVLF
jgi:hypothetical protein